MKRFIATLWATSVTLLALADGTSYIPATQTEVNAGTIHTKFVAPDTLAGWTGAGGGGAGGIATNGGTGINNSLSNLTVNPTSSTGPALSLTGPVFGLGTNLEMGEVWASDYGFSPTNTAAGNSNALNQAINQCTNIGGGVIRYGSRYSNSPGLGQVIALNGEHLFPVLTYPARIKLRGDGSTTINFTGTTTTNGVLFGQFDAENVFLTGPRTTNVADVYPYTNLVGISEVGFWDPELHNCYVSGFGQGVALNQLGSYRGALLDRVHATGCDIGFAVGDQCDDLVLVGSDARSCLFSYDQGCIVPNVTNSTYFPGMNSGSTGQTNVVGTHFVDILGGIWDYNYYASWVVGKGNLRIKSYAGNEHNYQLILGHPTNIITTIPYANEGNVNVTIDGSTWSENPVTTNIWVTPQGAGSVVHVINSSIGAGTGYGIIGVPNAANWDSGSFVVGTNWWFGSPTVGAFNFNRASENYLSGIVSGEFFDEAGGPYAASTIISRKGYHVSTSTVLTPFAMIFYAGDMTVRASLNLEALGGNNYLWNGTGVNFGTSGTNSGMWGAFTNSIYAPTNTAAVNVVSNFTPSNNLLMTNLTKGRVLVIVPMTLVAASSLAVGASAVCNEFVTNNGTGYQLQQQETVGSASTNTSLQTITFKLGPNDTVKFTTSGSGSSTETFPLPSQMVTDN